MAAGQLPKPGTEFGPCDGACKHRDCAETRDMAARLCPHCWRNIGYETPFYNVRGEHLAHAVCEENFQVSQAKR